jgi:hypothetical protein
MQINSVSVISLANKNSKTIYILKGILIYLEEEEKTGIERRGGAQ